VKEHSNWIKSLLGADGADSPTEENSDILQRMVADGDDLTKSRELDFHHLFDHKENAIAFEDAVLAAGYYKVDHDFWPEQGGWLTAVHVRMIPDLDEITATELALNEIALRLEGRADGWGCMEIIPTEAS
jgi:hypothetical protein